MEEIEAKGYATDCKPDELNFFSHQNVRQYVNALNNDPEGDKYPEDFDGPYYDSVELNEPWGNCVAIFITEPGNREAALKALNRYADNFVKDDASLTRHW